VVLSTGWVAFLAVVVVAKSRLVNGGDGYGGTGQYVQDLYIPAEIVLAEISYH
jgi:hypothetical protein